jgi:hypothetical protein
VTQLRKKVLEELERRNYSQATANAYGAAIRRFAEYFRRSPDQLEREHVRQYQLHLVQERKLEPKCGKSDRSSGSNRGSEVSPDSPGSSELGRTVVYSGRCTGARRQNRLRIAIQGWRWIAELLAVAV